LLPQPLPGKRECAELPSSLHKQKRFPVEGGLDQKRFPKMRLANALADCAKGRIIEALSLLIFHPMRTLTDSANNARTSI
jgi:hypothetical protein